MRRLWLLPILTVLLLTPATSAVAAPAPAAAPAPGLDTAGRTFLEYNTTGDGRAVEAVGDLTQADRIAIVIPGVDTTLAGFDRGLGGVQRRAPAFQARQVYGRMRALSPTAHVAVIAWLGYDPPEGIGLAAVREDRAEAGAKALVSFVGTLVAAHPAVAITVIGHSYGSVVAGLAAHRLAANVTGIIAIGSPGMGVANAAGLHTTARVWAGTAPSDWTKWIPGVRILGLGHGTRPTEWSFGARPLPVDGVEGHDGYFVSGTGSLTAMAQISLGLR